MYLQTKSHTHMQFAQATHDQKLQKSMSLPTLKENSQCTIK